MIARGGLDGAPWRGVQLEFHRWVVRQGAGEGDGFGRGNRRGNGSGPITVRFADRLRGSGESASRPLVDFDTLNDNRIKCLISCVK
jgi:hypothetical protein